jgi:hypothetical protein
MSVTGYFAHQVLHSGSSVIDAAGRTIEQSVNMIAGNEVPPAESLFHLGITGMIDERSMQEGLLRHGISVTVAGDPQFGTAVGAQAWIQELWNQHYFAQQHLPSPNEIFTLTNRGLFVEATLDRLLERHGFSDPRIRAAMSNLRFEVPGPSDLVRFSVRHVFEPDIVAALGYNDEFNATLDFFHRLQGLNYPIFSGPFGEQYRKFLETVPPEQRVDERSYERFGLSEPTWAQAFWWAHWVTISPSQAYEAFFRLRPGRNEAFDPPFARGINFTFDNLLQSLRVNDYPKKLRPILAAIAHRVPGIRFLRQLRATEVFTKADVTELLRRQGYSEGDAAVLAESVERNDRDVRRRGIEQQAKGQLARYWELGAIDSAQYRALLKEHGLTPTQADETVALADLDLKYKRLTKIIDFVRRQFIKGVLDANQAANQLRQAGVVNDRISVYIEDWQLEIQTKHREISAAKAVQWACKGLITAADLQARLENLGYRPEDVSALIAEARVCQAALASRAASQQAKQQAASARQLQQIQRDAARAIVNARRQLAAHGSPAQLRKWFCQGHLSQMDLYSRLRFLGWPDEDITRLISDCKSATGGKQGGQRGGSTVGGGPGVSGGGPGGGKGP